MVKQFYPFQSHFLDRDGLRYHYLDEGSGEPVVMVHGNPSWSFYYRNLALDLRDSHRVVVPDHIGCGLSDKPGDERYTYTLESRTADLTALLDHLSLTKDLTLVLHDWGGMIGLLYACRHPERIKRLVLLNTSGFRLPATKPLPLALKLGRNTRVGEWLIRRLNAFARCAAYIGCKANPMSATLRRDYCAPYDNWDNRIAVARFVQDIPLREGDPAYAAVMEVEAGLENLAKVPAQIIWGEKDFVFDRHFLAEWRKRWPHAQYHTFPEAGHYVLEDVGSRVIPLIREFLKTTT